MDRVQAILPEVRWAICSVLYKWREFGTNEVSIKGICDKMKYGLSQSQVREQICYLNSIGLCTLEDLPNGAKFATRTALLTDLVEYRCDCPEGIARPPQEWFGV